MATLYLIATPIGNLADMAPRAIDTLKSLQVLFCEDTRHTGNLLNLLGIPHPRHTLSNHDYNEKGTAARIVRFLDQGLDVGVCSDAGFPVISDPGYPAVTAAIEAGHDVTVIPGPCAGLMALAVSGLPADSFTFKGFAPRKPGARRKFLAEDAESTHTMVFYESPFRIVTLLEEALEAYGNRNAALCLELTKQFERVHRDTLENLIAQFKDQKIKGEAVIVIAGKAKAKTRNEDEDRPAVNDADSGYVPL